RQPVRAEDDNDDGQNDEHFWQSDTAHGVLLQLLTVPDSPRDEGRRPNQLYHLHMGPCSAGFLMRCAVAAAIGTLIAAPASRAQFAARVNLVQVYATVTDRENRHVRGLSANDFAVREDGRPEAISTFAAGEMPLALAVAIDRSFSIPSGQLTAVVAA